MTYNPQQPMSSQQNYQMQILLSAPPVQNYTRNLLFPEPLQQAIPSANPLQPITSELFHPNKESNQDDVSRLLNQMPELSLMVAQNSTQEPHYKNKR